MSQKAIPRKPSNAPRLPGNWRALLARARQEGYPDTPKHRLAYRNFVQRCFPTYVNTTDPDARAYLDAWWVLCQLPYDGVWQYWLTAPESTTRRARTTR